MTDGLSMGGTRPVRYVTFVHKSPYATWNPLQAWIRRERQVPHEVVLVVQDDRGRNADLAEAGIKRVLSHYGATNGSTRIRRVLVPTNLIETWQDALEPLLSDPSMRRVIDVTPARTVPKLAVTGILDRDTDVDLFYLDVAAYRYESKPFAWIPYNQQTIRSLIAEDTGHTYKGVQALGPPPGAPAELQWGTDLIHLGPETAEMTVPWEGLIVLLNEAAAVGLDGGRNPVDRLRIKLPLLHDRVLAEYDLHTRRFELKDWDGTVNMLEAAKETAGAWADQYPNRQNLKQWLAGARLLPFHREDRLLGVLHEAAWATRGIAHDASVPWPALDTNLFYAEFITTLANKGGIPTVRIPVVTSSIVVAELDHRSKPRQMPAGAPPVGFEACDVHRPLIARSAAVALQEFKLLEDRCRMNVIRGNQALRDNQANDKLIRNDFAAYTETAHHPLHCFTIDRDMARGYEALGLEHTRVSFSDPAEHVATHADIDQVAYLIYQLAVGFGCVKLKGTGAKVYGDHPTGSGRYGDELVRIRLQDRSWARAFVHERRLRPLLDEVVKEGRLWLG